MTALATLKADLAAVHPLAPYIAIAAVAWLVVYLWRRFHPASFEKMPKWVQGVPAVIVSAILSGVSDPGDAIWHALVEAVFGGGAGAFSVAGHHFAKALPKKVLAYTGNAEAGRDIESRGR